jgi:hypothetical protein
MKQIALTLTLILGFLSISAVSQSTIPIFRSIKVGLVGERSISLGGSLTKVTDLLAKTEDGFVMTHGFGGANRIKILVTKSGKVREMIFEYGTEADFETKVASYTESLGKPVANESSSSGNRNTRLAAWDDRKTRFEILETSENGKTTVSSAMIDKVVH